MACTMILVIYELSVKLIEAISDWSNKLVLMYCISSTDKNIRQYNILVDKLFLIDTNNYIRLVENAPERVPISKKRVARSSN